MLTKVQKKRLAREARKLAFECLTNGPTMQNRWCGCAIGLSLRRAQLLPTDASGQRQLGHEVENILDPRGFFDGAILSEATTYRMEGNPTAVVFPLLALADALEESSEQPRAAHSKDF